MSVPTFSVHRPIAVLMATLAIAVFGWLSLSGMPVELLPNLAYPTLTVQTEYPDAAPISVEQFVTRPIEEAVGVIPGVRDMRSTSRAGLSEVVLHFEWGEPMDFAALDAREKLGLVELPLEAARPRVLRYDPSLDPIARLAFSGDRPLDELRQIAERWVKPRLESVTGVAAAKVRGGLDPEIMVEADEDRLAALGLTLEDLSRALAAENVNLPGGTLKDLGAVYLVRTLHEFDDLEQLERTVVREGPGGRVRVEDVARVSRGHRDREEVTRNEGAEVVELALHREGSANTVAVAAELRRELAALEEELAEDLSLTLLTDRSVYIAAAVKQVWSAALMGGILAVVVLFFFLRDLPSTAIVAMSIPISVVATFLPLAKTGVTLNIMSLGGLALGVGMLVDNSIVVLEAIDRRRREGLSRRAAAAQGASEVAGAVTAATLTTVSVFLPVVFVRGIAGQLFYDLAVTVCFSLVASLLVSLTVIPALAALDKAAGSPATRATLFAFDRGGWGGISAARLAAARRRAPRSQRMKAMRRWLRRRGLLDQGKLLPPLGDGVHVLGRSYSALLWLPRLVLALAALLVGVLWWAFSKVFHVVTWPARRAFESLESVYPRLLSRALALRFLVLAAAVIVFALAIAAVPGLGTDLVPDLAQGEFAFRLRLPEGTPLESTAEVVERIEAQLSGDALFAQVFSVAGSLPGAAAGRQTFGENLAQIDFVLAPDSDSVAEERATARVREVLDLFPRVDAELVRPAAMSLSAPVAVAVYSDDLEMLEAAAGQIAELVGGLPGITDLATSIEPGSPEVTLAIDRERAARLGLDGAQVSQSLRRQIRGEVVGQFREGEERLDIRLRASERFRNRASEVEALRVRLPDGSTLPISALAEVEVSRGPATIHRREGSRTAEITAEAPAGDLGRVLTDLGSRLPEANVPAGAVAEMSGQDEELRLSVQSLRLALMLAIFLVYVVMAAQFESLIHPFVILLAVPLGAVGAIAALALTDTPLSVLALIGAVMLAGIVVNNAIVLVDAIGRRRREGESLDEAIVGAGGERLRPIVMTTTTTVLALTPMAFGLGAGDELRAPLAITVIGGLTAATLLTLIVVPCLYRVMTRAKAAAPEVEPVPATAQLSEGH